MHSRTAITKELLSIKWVSCLWFIVESSNHGSGEIYFSIQQQAVVIFRDMISNVGRAQYIFMPREWLPEQWFVIKHAEKQSDRKGEEEKEEEGM
jgi:hypothetical protein